MKEKEEGMPILRGDLQRKKFVELNQVVCCLGNDIVPEGRPLTCCCGKPIAKGEYFIIAYRKPERVDLKTLYAGPSCGPKILQMAGINCPGLFTDQSEGGATAKLSPVSGGESRMTREEYAQAINMEAMQAIQMLFLGWGKQKPGKIFDCFCKLSRAGADQIPLHQIVTINNAARNSLPFSNGCTSLREYAAQKANGRKLKRINFKLLEAALGREGRTSFL